MRKLLLATLLATPLLSFAAPTNLVVNGSFEADAVASGTGTLFTAANPLTGWTVGNQAELYDNKLGVAQDGSNFAELDNGQNHRLQQVLTTVVGTTYDLSFYFSNGANTLAATNGLSFLIPGNGTIILSTADNATSGNVWQLYTSSFVATSTATSLTFQSAGTQDGFGTALDNISVIAEAPPVAAVPEPETYALMLAGLSAIGMIARRRKTAVSI